MALVASVSRPRRSDKLLEAIKNAIEKRKNTINNEPDVRSVAVIVKMKSGTDTPRVVLVNVETEDELDKENGR